MNRPPLPIPEDVWNAMRSAENLRSVLPPFALCIISMQDANGVPHDFACYAGNFSIAAGAEPVPPPPGPPPKPVIPGVSMKVVVSAGLFVHADPLPGQTHLNSAHLGSLPFGAVVQIIPGTEVNEVTVQKVTHTWVKIAQGGWVAKDLLSAV